MSTTKKGTAFEKRVASLVQQEIDEGRFPAPAGMARVFQQKTYTSKDRGPIKCDVSVEVSMPGSEEPSILFIIECKDHSNPIKAEVAQNLSSILDQIAGSKGIIASTAPFQSGTYSFAKSKRIGLLRVHDGSSLKWELHRDATVHSETSLLKSQMLDDATGALFSPFIWSVQDQYGSSLSQLFGALANDTLHQWQRPSSGISVQHISKEEIQRVANEVLAKVNYQTGAVPLEEVCKRETSDSGLELVIQQAEPTQSARILGSICFSPLTITLFRSPADNISRSRFTLAHELGHHFLRHARYISREVFDLEDIELDDAAVGPVPRELRKLEWQANYFAACLLMPRTQLVLAFDELAKELDLQDRGHGLLYRDDQACNVRAFQQMTSRLLLQFQVSKTALCLRLTDLGLLREERQATASVSNVLRTLF